MIHFSAGTQPVRKTCLVLSKIINDDRFLSLLDSLLVDESEVLMLRKENRSCCTVENQYFLTNLTCN